MANLLDRFNAALAHGVEIAVNSSIPIGCGMGSSAAAVVSVLYALSNFLQYDWPLADY